MRLKRLIVHGFKSFKDRTTIHFDDGITGIVGPNGCGKSNIVDALFWVMGEQSAKHLRGNTMKDVIFAGSSKYKPGLWSEVTLVLGNEEMRHIHIGNKVVNPSEIQITRKLYRNGETEYRLNTIPCRLKDIQEVFMDTGAGAKSYSIIAQGEINRLVQAKPEERRVMIEEVAGITKYKIRKRDSLKKIDQAETNLGRLNDLQIEIEKNLKTLRSQSERAEKARSLKEKVKRNEVIVNSHKVYDYLKTIKEGRDQTIQMEQEIENWSLNREGIETSLENERILKDELTEKLDELSAERNEVSKNLAAKEERLSGLCSQLTEKENLIESREKEIQELQVELLERKEKLSKLEVSREDLRSEEESEFDCSDLEEKVENLKEELDLKDERVRELSEESLEKKSELTDIQRKIFQNNSKIEEYSHQLQDITAETEELEQKFSCVSTQISDERENVQEAQRKLKEHETNFLEVKEKIGDVVVTKQEAFDRYQKKNEEIIKLKSQLSSLKEINESLEGVKDGAQEFLKTHDSEKIDLFGNLIQCKDEFTRPVQTLLSPFLDLLISMEGESEVLNWSQDHLEMAADIFIPLISQNETISEKERVCDRQNLETRVGAEVKSLDEIIKIPLRFENVLDPFLKNFYLIPSLPLEKISGLDLGKSINGVITHDAQIQLRKTINGKIVSLLGDEKNSLTGVIARNNRMDDLAALLVDAEKELVLLEEQKKSEELSFTELKDREESTRDEVTLAKTESITLETILKNKLENMESGSGRLKILSTRKEEISEKRLTLMEEEEKISLNEKFLEEKIEENTDILSELQDQVMEIKSSYEEERELLLEKQMEAKTFQNRLQQMLDTLDDVSKQVEKQNSRMESYQNLVVKYSEEVVEIESELSEIEKGNQDLAEMLENKDETLSDLKDQLSELLIGMQTRENEIKELVSGVNKNEKEISTFAVKMSQAVTEEEQVVRNIFEKYQIDLRQSLGEFLDFESSDYVSLNDLSGLFQMETETGSVNIERIEYEFHRRYGQDLKDCQGKFKQYRSELIRLGDINWQAIENYEKQKLRFDFLRDQETDLRKSLEDLQNAIDLIDLKSKERFKVAFLEVSTRFEKVFPIIFGGGSAKLNLTGNINDLDCGVDIIAQPPGKKMQNINLMSGGEKAMTAVSLIFSIFLVKPSPFCLLDEVDAPLDDANVGRFNELLREMSGESQFILITHNKKTMELNDTLYGVTMQEPGISKAVSVQLQS